MIKREKIIKLLHKHKMELFELIKDIEIEWLSPKEKEALIIYYKKNLRANNMIRQFMVTSWADPEYGTPLLDVDLQNLFSLEKGEVEDDK